MWLPLVFLCIQASIALPRFVTDYPKNSKSVHPDAKLAYFDNKVNHFDFNSKETFKQRYWYIDEHFDRSSGPAILFIQGEAPGDAYAERPVPLYLAKETKGIWFALEHRFYGTSQPCKDWSLESLKLLTHDQAMADIANFIVNKTKEMDNVKRKWLLVGGSYAGALVIWFKSRYPHLADVVYSSSGVVNVIEDFSDYMQQVTDSLREDSLCFKAVFDIVNHAVNLIRKDDPEDKKELKEAMKAGKLNDKDFLSYVTELYLGEVQYSNRIGVCTLLKKLPEERDILKRIALYAELGRQLGCVPENYDLTLERNITINPRSSSRQWMYQVCSAYGWFATGKATIPLRPKELDIPYFKDICKRIFDTDLYPNVDYTNGMLGDLRIPPLLKQIVMVNGKDDPWKWAGYFKNQVTNNDMLIRVIDCPDCSHCIDLYDSKPTDHRNLSDMREIIKKKIVGWMTAKTDGTPKISY